MESVQLYYSKTEAITISIDAYFEGDCLVIDGYDIGSTVEEYWGDSDYEYVARIPPAGVDFLYAHLGVPRGKRKELLEALADRYNTSRCYSEIRKLMEDNNIRDEGFTWV